MVSEEDVDRDADSESGQGGDPTAVTGEQTEDDDNKDTGAAESAGLLDEVHKMVLFLDSLKSLNHYPEL